MPADFRLTDLRALQVLDSRSRPTLMCRATLRSGEVAYAAVPSGASTGSREAVELRDADPKQFLGAGVTRAVTSVNTVLRSALLGKDVREQRQLDELLIALDGTPDRSHLGANAILAVSMVLARLSAVGMQCPLYARFGELYPDTAPLATLPVPMFNVLNGGAHANNPLDIQEFMVLPTGVSSFAEALRAGAEIYGHLRLLLDAKGFSTSVGDEGGFAPPLSDTRQALDFLLKAVEKAGYRPGEDVQLGLDCAASEFCRDGRYEMHGEQLHTDAAGLCDWLAELASNYPICSIEDGMDEGDAAGWQLLTQKLGERVQLVGDDVFVTRAEDLRRGAEQKIANAILIKPNQVGTISETMDAIICAFELNYGCVISHRSGETEDCAIADLAVGTAAGQCKMGAPCRSERVAKYNRLMWIELDEKFAYAGAAALAPRSPASPADRG